MEKVWKKFEKSLKSLKILEKNLSLNKQSVILEKNLKYYMWL